MKKILKIIFIIVVTIILVGSLGICTFSGVMVFKESMQLVNNETTKIEDSAVYLEKYKIETLKLESSLDGHEIPADYITINGDKNKDTVILVHGLGGNRVSVYPMAELFLKNGYNVITYDQRSSGENFAKYTTFGYLESYDLGDYVTYANSIIGKDNKIGIWGLSFGGATTGIYLGSEEANKDVDFAILDSPLSNVSYMISTELEKMNMSIPTSFMMKMGNIATKMKLGFSYEDTNVCNYVKKTKVPVLVINSKVDELTPYSMGKEIYDATTSSKKKIFTVEDSKHANIFFDYKSKYEKTINDFIGSIEIN